MTSATRPRPPLTWKALGSTRCVGCERKFADDSRPTVETVATDYAGGRPNYSANRPVEVTRIWHAECLSRFEAQNEAYRQLVADDRARMVAALKAEWAASQSSATRPSPGD
jgi:hypothetical protein